MSSPEFLFAEFEEYKEELTIRTERTIEDFQILLTVLRKKINIIYHEEIEPFIDDAKKISPDEKDTVYFALALKLHSAIWSNDKALKEKQNTVKVFHTVDLLRILEIL